MAQKSVSSKLRNKSAAGQPRRHSTANHRASLAHIFFGSSPLLSQASDKNSSQFSIGRRKFSRDSSLLRRVHFSNLNSAIPIDSRTKHEFKSDNESGGSDSEAILGPAGVEKSPDFSRRNSKIVSRLSFSSTPSTSNVHFHSAGNSAMRKVMRVVVVGAKKAGKTAMLQQLARYQDVSNQPYVPTIDDTYQIQTQVDADDRSKELIVFHDTAGVMDFGPLELKRPYIQVADAFVLVYSVLDQESFNRMDLLKKFIERQFGKEKKEVPIVVVGTMIDLPGRQVDTEFALHWASREKVKLFEISSRDRHSILDVVHFLSGRYFHPLKEPKFSISKRLKPEKSNAQIVMDF